MSNVETALSTRSSADVKISQAELYLEYWFEHGVNFKHRIIQITGEIKQPLFNRIDAALTEMESDSARKTITIRINSDGGSVYEAMAIVGRIRHSTCRIVTEGYGSIASAATLILAAGDKSVLSEYTSYMLHQPSYGVPSFPNIHTHEAILIQTKKEWKYWAKWMSKLTGYKDEKFWYNAGTTKDKYLTPKQCLEKNIINSVIWETKK